MTLPYIKCDPCIEGDHDRCIGRTNDRPFCGCSLCPWLLEGTHDHPSDGGSQLEQPDP